MKNQPRSINRTRQLTGIAMLSAAAAVLMFLDFSIPFLIPGFVKMDVSELPALLASFAYGPLAGAAVCLIKNLINLTHTTTAAIGELCNFLLGICFVIPAGIIYHKIRTRKGAVIGALVGSASMAIFSLPINYFISYPMYAGLFGGMERIIGAYQALLPGVGSLFGCLTIFNMPFTFAKGLLCSLLCFLIYKPLSPILHGKR